MAFDAFISYSHAADGRLAPALQQAMQRLAKPWYRQRSLRVFRDESALSANPHLWSSIQTAMDEANWFVLLASPDAAASEWVNRELDHWLATKSADHILVVLTDGTLAWEPAAHGLVGTAVPQPLRGAFADEPRHVDLRWARTETDLDMHNARFRDVAAQLAAPIHGIAKDDLDSEDVRQHRRAQRLARGGVTTLTLLVVIALVASALALAQRNRAAHAAGVARSERDLADRQAEAAIAGRAATSSAAEPPGSALSLLLAVEGYERAASDTTRDTLLHAVVQVPQLVGRLPGSSGTSASAISPDGNLVVAGGTDGALSFWRPRSQRVARIEQPASVRGSAVVSVRFDASGRHVYALHTNGDVERLDTATRRSVGPILPVVDVRHLPCGQQCGGSTPTTLAVSPDDRHLAVAVSGAWNQVNEWDLAANKAVGAFGTGSTASDLNDNVAGIAYSPAGGTLYVSTVTAGLLRVDARTLHLNGPTITVTAGLGGWIATADLAGHEVAIDGSIILEPRTGRVLHSLPSAVGVDPVAMSDDGSFVARPNSDGDVEVRATASGAPIGPIIPTPRPSSLSLSRDGLLCITSTDGTAVWQLVGAGALARAPAFAPRTRANAPAPAGLVPTAHLAPGLLGRRSPNEVLVALSPDGKRLAYLNDGNLELVDPTNGEADANVAVRPLQPSSAGLLAFDSDGRRLTYDNFFNPGVIALPVESGERTTRNAKWTVEPTGGTGATRYAIGSPLTLSGPAGPYYVLDLRTDTAVARLDGTTAIADLRRGHVGADTAMFEFGFVDDGSVDPTGRYAATISTLGDVLLFDAHTGAVAAHPVLAPNSNGFQNLLQSRGLGVKAIDVAFSADGRELAVAHDDGSITRLAVPSLHPIGTATSGVPDVEALAYQPGGDYLIAATGFSAATFIDRETGQVVARVPLLTDRSNGSSANIEPVIQFGDSGRELLTSGVAETHPALLWSMQPSDWVRAACTMAGRNMTRTEWTQYVGALVPYHRTCAQWPKGV